MVERTQEVKRRPRNLSIINEEELNSELRTSAKKQTHDDTDYSELMKQMKKLSEYNSQHNSNLLKNFSSNSISLHVIILAIFLKLFILTEKWTELEQRS